VTTTALLVDLRARGVVVEAHGDRLRLLPADRVTPDELATLRAHKVDVLRLLADVASLEGDGTAQIWRRVYEDLPDRDRERLAAEVAEGDPLALRLALLLDVPPVPTGHGLRRGVA